MDNIKRISPAEATGEAAEFYKEAGAAPILQCLSLRPDFGKAMNDVSNIIHFSDGFLSRREHEAIATYVSALNHCPF